MHTALWRPGGKHQTEVVETGINTMMNFDRNDSTFSHKVRDGMIVEPVLLNNPRHSNSALLVGREER
jgi:hypothetical protein